MTGRDIEYAALRRTIAIRGTVRIVLIPWTFVSWAGLNLVLVYFSALPAAALFTLAVLAAGFEAIHALHVGVERIGRYIQVAYEEAGHDNSVTGSQPGWETTAMKVGPGLPGGGVDPLFTILFCGAAIANLIPAVLPVPTPIEIGLIGALHVGFISRVVRARVAAARQRAAELARFRELNSPRATPSAQDS